ncbi:alpha-amylase family glycosyl hydrolase [Opitutus sp. ER46]|uniref:alpha-amylase family glycosyl hydrolase n=1 Tax=Opitutus sp. ER46 TaxID=2161864 RepID=UPI000D307610|nr:alpha-amylase family glycosyl hydrolase [Opitutus sp. ER46]PTX90757.1 glycoside hydrolase family 1 [Opitutus sp. ER46]
MAEHPHRIVRAWLESPSSGIIELDRDWTMLVRPRFTLGRHCPALSGLVPVPGLAAGRAYGYFLNALGEISFVLPLEHGCAIDPQVDTVYLAGNFNDWSAAVGQAEWRLRPAKLDGERVLMWTGEATRFLLAPGLQFKFVTGEHQWLTPPGDAPNVVRDPDGNLNRMLDPTRTGWHLWRFSLGETLDLAEAWTVAWADPVAHGAAATVPVVPGNFFYELETHLELGAIVRGGTTVFRLFAPRARAVTLYLSRELGDPVNAQQFALSRRADAEGEVGIWEVTLDHNLHGAFYWYSVDGRREAGFDPLVKILDPYALATVDRQGPGIVVDKALIGHGDRRFRTPDWHDLIIAEAHVRDLVANAPIKATTEQRRGFTGLKTWIESPEFHLGFLGVNAIEFQPVHEFDNARRDEYGWGYMPTSYFAPESSYALAPERASGIREFQDVVTACHRRGMAVILDVVFNHVGLPPHLMYIDRLYYFEQDAHGALANWSGCGNDLRARSAMARRLIVDSCIHYIETYGVDGFRFDLAELLGLEVLREIEAALKRVKPNVILIAEPWSFRGHIAGALRDTGWASWNDGFRDFVRDYVRGNGAADRMEYFLRGSPWYFAKWPAQTVNYTESHDDRTWIDVITENPHGNGFTPTANDQRRTHLMAALLFMSLGIPMLAAGQDFLRSKHGVTNTYQHPEVNALEYRRLYRYLSTHAYFADWIAFRRGEIGRLLRQYSRPTEGFFQFFHAPGSPALAALYNADFSQGPLRLLFAINPTLNEVMIPIGAEIAGSVGAWDPLADQDRFYWSDAHGATLPVEAELFLPALSCGLWISEE